MRLLIAEDDTRLLRSLTHILERERYLIDGVTNGEDALAYAETSEYDGLVLDIMMPGLDGVPVLKRLRMKGVDTPALFLTAKAEVADRVEGLDAGADDYLAKPFAVPSESCLYPRPDPGWKTGLKPFYLRAMLAGQISTFERQRTPSDGDAFRAARVCDLP